LWSVVGFGSDLLLVATVAAVAAIVTVTTYQIRDNGFVAGRWCRLWFRLLQLCGGSHK